MTGPHPTAWRGRRVLFVLPTLELGGTERQAFALAAHLAKDRGCVVTLWGAKGGDTLPPMAAAHGLLTRVVPMRFPCRRSTLVRQTLTLARALRAEAPDILLTYCRAANVACGLAAPLARVPFWVWNERSALPADQPARLADRLALSLAPAVVCNAGHLRTALQTRGWRTRRPIDLVPNGVTLAAPAAPPEVWRQRLDIPPGAYVGVAVAHLRAVKDHATLVRAWARVAAALAETCRAAVLVLAGAPTDAAAAALDGEIAARGLTSAVRRPGAVADIGGLLAIADVGLLPSRSEGLPNAVIEYMLAGLPVAATDIPGVREALGPDAGVELAPVGDADALAHQIVTLARDPETARATGARLRARAAERFAPETMLRSMAAILERA